MTRTRVASAVGAIAMAAAWIGTTYVREESGTSSDREDGYVVLAGNTDSAARTERAGELPMSMAGTDVPDGIRVDGNGQLIVDRGLQATFDYFLTATEELSLDQKHAIASRHLASKLVDPALTQARVLLGHYAAYLNEAARLNYRTDPVRSPQYAPPATDFGALRQRLDTRRALREKHLGADVARNWFGEQDRLDQIALKRSEILASAAPEGEKRRSLAALEAQLPFEVKRAQAASLWPTTVMATIATLRQHGTSDQAIRQRLNGVVDYQEAERLSAMLKKDAEWDGRYNDYARRRNEIEQMAGLGGPERERMISRAREQSFPKSSDLLLAETRDRVAMRGELRSQDD